jgi:hypothetical protein
LGFGVTARSSYIKPSILPPRGEKKGLLSLVSLKKISQNDIEKYKYYRPEYMKTTKCKSVKI